MKTTTITKERAATEIARLEQQARDLRAGHAEHIAELEAQLGRGAPAAQDRDRARADVGPLVEERAQRDHGRLIVAWLSRIVIPLTRDYVTVVDEG
mgnify:CR=1 FL=1